MTPLVLRSLAVGIVLWAIGIGVIAALPIGFDGGPAQVYTYALSIPAAWLSVRTIVRVTGARPAQQLQAVAIASTPAMLVHGLLLGFFPGLFRVSPSVWLAGAAWLLWMGGLMLILALWKTP